MRCPDTGELENNNTSSSRDGVAHTDELAFLFTSVLAQPMERQSREYVCLKRMISLWTQFAETGNPNTTKLPEIKWRSLHQTRHHQQHQDSDCDADEAYKCLNIGDELEFIDLPEMEKLKVWKSLYEIHREMPERPRAVDVIAYAQSSL